MGDHEQKGPVPPEAQPVSGEFKVIAGKLNLGEDDVKQLGEMAAEAFKDAKGSLRDAAEIAAFKGDEELAAQIVDLDRELDVSGVVPLGENWIFNEVHIFYIPPTTDEGEELSDCFGITAFNTKTGKMLCYGFGPENPSAEVKDDRYAYHIDFIANYTLADEQDLRILWSDGANATHPEEQELEAELRATAATAEQPMH